MRVLFVHNRYQLAGGEERVFESEIAMLKSRGHIVETYEEDSATIRGVFNKLVVAFGFAFSFGSYFRIRKLIKQFKPDVVHVHNYFPKISPSVFYVCKNLGVPVVHTLHNYRSICPTGLLFYEGSVNESSVNSGPFWAVRHRVYRNSLLATLVLACSIYIHRRLNTWSKAVDKFIALTDFQRNKFIEAGWPADKIGVKPNFADSGAFRLNISSTISEQYCLFVGRLSEEKGVRDLLTAWEGVACKLKIVGDGPLLEFVKNNKPSNVELLGAQCKRKVSELMSGAAIQIVASTCYEAFGLVVVEAYSCGTPVIAPKLGGLSDLVIDGKTGALYRAGEPADLRKTVNRLLKDKANLFELRLNAIEFFDSYYTEDKNYDQLIRIYSDARGVGYS